ncbi:YdcF family protein [Aurantimonas marina]|uniref:YdcF family protein n=1 Tax=Aurantimonas marina TaxID=2780508 RepID=UPI001E409A5F|nr:YdcF family protein [Aurantimonas marina]
MAAWSPEMESGADRAQRRTRSWFGRRWLTLTIAAIGVTVFGYLAGGFLRFTEEVGLLSRSDLVEPADGIVVLTGGALRIDQAIDLLKDGRGRRLLISGVNPGTSADTLARMTGTDPSWFECCVDIDRDALNTVGNAEMASLWARERGFRDLILVTSDYHMPRSLREFERIDDIRSVTPYAVQRDDLWGGNNLPNGLGMRVLVTEYAKLVAARFRALLGIGQPGSMSTQLARLDH